jgi:uncharacterized protein
MPPTASDIIARLGLKRHPTCGFVAETFRSRHQIPSASLPTGYEGGRPMGSVLYFMVTPDVPIALHRIRNDQMYHHYLGSPLEVLLLYQDGTGEKLIAGPDLEAGMRPQLFIPGGTFHISRLLPGEDFALLGTTEWPGVEPSDVELGDPQGLQHQYPEHKDDIKVFVRQNA